MKNCKKILQLLSIFAFFVLPVVNGAEFRQIDFERLLKGHPMMKNYDPETGRFKNTPSEIVPVETLDRQIASITSELVRLEKEKAELVLESLETSSDSEDMKVWSEIGRLDQQMNNLRKAMEPIRSLREDGGSPGFDKVLAVAAGLFRDTVSAHSSENTIVLNKLPRFRALPPEFSGRDLRCFFITRDMAVLENYLARAGLVGLMFSQTDKTILYSGKE